MVASTAVFRVRLSSILERLIYYARFMAFYRKLTNCGPRTCQDSIYRVLLPLLWQPKTAQFVF